MMLNKGHIRNLHPLLSTIISALLSALMGILLFAIALSGSFLMHMLSYPLSSAREGTSFESAPANKAELSQEVADYLIGKSSSLSPKHFGELERQHMEDVKSIFLRGKLAFVFLVLIFFLAILTLAHFGDDITNSNLVSPIIGKAYLLAGIVGFTASLSLLIFSMADFDAFFTFFHMPLFEAGTWEFPQDSMLIRLYPGEFFYNKAIAIFTTFFIIANLFIAEGYFIVRRGKVKSGALPGSEAL